MSPLLGGIIAAVLVLAVMSALGRALRPATASGGDLPGSRRADPRRVAQAIVAGVAVLFVTRWPVMAVAGAVMAASAERLLHDRTGARGIAHLEAIATWLEELRDVLRASSMGVEEALERSLGHAGAALGDAGQRYAEARRRGARVDEALDDLGAAMRHPLGVAAVAALQLVVRGGTGAARLHPTMAALAGAARDEITARQRIARVRDVYRSSMKRLIAIAVVLVVYLRLAAADLLAPYGTPTGQIVLAVPLLSWAGCIAWLDRLCRHGAVAIADPIGWSHRAPAPPLAADAPATRQAVRW